MMGQAVSSYFVPSIVLEGVPSTGVPVLVWMRHVYYAFFLGGGG